MTKLTAYHLPGAWGLPSVSPFCLKLDAWLRMAGVEHVSVTASTPFGGPKGKAPWIEHDGRKIGDSTLIIQYLKEKLGVDTNAHLNAEQRGMAVAIHRMIDENLYWAMVNDRWNTPENWPILKSTVLGGIPAPIRAIMAPIARRGVRKQLKGHGIGCHSAAEIAAIGKRDIDALAAILGDKPFFFGDTPSEIDAVAYGQLANIHDVGFSSPMKAVIAGHANLVAFIERFRGRFYPG
jgi:glutathione S-transferase